MSLVWALFAVLLLAAAAMDLSCYRIPNVVVLALLALFGVIAISHAPAGAWQDHLLTGLAGLAVMVGIYAFGAMGAGDAKLIAATVLWCGLGALMPLLFWIAVSGLAVAAILVSMRITLSFPEVQRAFCLTKTLPRVLRRHEGIPYGVAIALGALIASSSFPDWLWAR